MSNTFSALVRIGSDPEIRVIPSGKSLLTFSAASTTGFGDKKQTMWLRVSYWNNPEKMASYIVKGQQIYVAGELTQREYESNGQTKVSMELNVNTIDFVSGQGNGGQQLQAPSKPPQQQAKPQQSNADDFSDEIPF